MGLRSGLPTSDTRSDRCSDTSAKTSRWTISVAPAPPFPLPPGTRRPVMEMEDRMADDLKCLPAVYAAIEAVMADVGKDGIAKDRRNDQQKYNFRGIDDVYNALAPILAKHHLIIVPRTISREKSERVSIKDD